jgi:hypothetical protein
MSISTEPQNKAKRNTQAIASLILGMMSIVFALFYLAPGLLSALGCVGAIAALLAFLAGVQGLRAARGLDEQGRKLAIAGMGAGGLGLLVFIVLMASSVLRAQREFETLLTPQPPQTFQGDDFTLTYPSGWQSIDIGQQAFCGQPGVECLFGISHPTGDGTNINLIRFALEQEATVEEIDQALWAQFEAGTPDVTLESREVIEIRGQPATRRIFNVPSPSTPSGRAHVLQIYIVKGRALYQFTGWTPGPDALTQHQAEIEEIITNIQFTP